MIIRCHLNKLESTILDLNQKGYTVKSSYIDGAEYVLKVKKTHLISMQSLMHVMNEDVEITEFPKRNNQTQSMWKGIMVRWLHRA